VTAVAAFDFDGTLTNGGSVYPFLVSLRGSGPVLRARGLLRNGGEQPELWAYGNSRGDLRLLNAADHGVDAGLLGPLGRLRRFPRLSEVIRQSEVRPQPGVAATPTTRPE
jgi:hypothetical protein